MKKCILILVTAIALVSQNAPAQYHTVTLNGATSPTTTNITITVPAGKIMQVLTFSAAKDDKATRGRLELLLGEQFAFLTHNFTHRDIQTSPHFFICGPATLRMRRLHELGDGFEDRLTQNIDGSLVLSYKLFDNSTVSGATTPSTAVVIPADAAGPVQIILESSTDLTTWTAATPGSYASSTSRRFFRVRAITQ